MKLWGGRFETGPSEVFEQFSGSLHFDRKLVFADVEGSQAFARALARQNILSADECGRLIAAFEEIGREANDPKYFEGADDEDVHTFVIRKLTEKVGALSAKIHTGRSRNEQVSLDIRLYLRASCDVLLRELTGLLGQLLALAGKYPDAVIPGYTHLRRAQAVLWPHYLLAYFEMFARDFERTQQARARINVLPLGSGALAGSGFPFDRQAIADDLAFPAITRNSMDVSGDRDFALDFLFCCSTIMLHLSRLAEDWILYSSEEFNWMTLGDGVTSGSSLMPQKKNPDSLELIRGKTGRVFGDLTSLLVTMKGLPMTYNRDMQEDKEPVFDAVDTLLVVLPATAGMIATMRVDADRLEASAPEGFALATDVAEYLVRQGVVFRDAHEAVGRLVVWCTEHGCDLHEVSDGDLAALDPHLTPDIRSVLSVQGALEARSTPGGTAPVRVAEQLAAVRSELAQRRVWAAHRA
jgi:argininosuccinate lyase